jgi:hypothetical protein
MNACILMLTANGCLFHEEPRRWVRPRVSAGGSDQPFHDLVDEVELCNKETHWSLCSARLF